MAEAAKLKDEGIRRGSGGDKGNGSSVAAAFGKFGEYPRRWREFIHEVRVEMRQVTWPTQHEVVVTTFVVIVAVAFFGLFFFGVDNTVLYLTTRIFNLFKH
jgi:preprotein translocase SecE subunit